MEEINLKELFNMFWGKRVLILVIIAIFACIGISYGKFFVKPEYKATSTLVLTKNSTDGETITQNEVILNQKLVATYTIIVKTNDVLKQVISNLGYDMSEEELKNNVSVSLVTNSQLIEISVINENPKIAQALTNEIAKVFIEKVKDIYKMNNISVVDDAKIPTEPYNINRKKDILIFSGLGVVIAFGIVFISSLFDTTIKTAEEAEKRLELNVLATIPNYNDTKKKGKK